MDKLARGLVQWNGENGQRMDQWNPMRGSLRLTEFGDFRNFAIAIISTYPYCQNSPAPFISGMLHLVEKLRNAARDDGDEGDEKANNTIDKWTKNLQDPSLLSIIKCSADAVPIRDFQLYSHYIVSNIKTIKSLYCLLSILTVLEN
jgi:hypothetical protein